MNRISRIGAGAVGLVVALSLSACGSDGSSGDSKDSKDSGIASLSAKKIADKAQAAMKKVESATIAGEVTTDGEQIGIDLTAGDDGTCHGSMEIKGGKAEIIKTSDASFMRGNEAFWTTVAGDKASAVVALLGDKWAKLGADDTSLEDVCDIDELFSDFDEEFDGTVTKGETGDVDGVDAIELIAKTDDGTTHFWVATDGEPYILKAERTDGDEPGALTLTDFGEAVGAVAPAADEVVDLGALGG